ncbi:non-ribosomal peptide synthetase [Streptomyces sp. MST-110588]|uniref:non-ribosomal peptide synthetase n=1 Tax=Streptomyces sp. MST-110588 TaxID=2833628 RepID=UPI001F5D5A66|nr:non-ribosomal peptide synthetase [Streptomyces sp. MST-110588]UNO38536.1 non-ribosomal peptide synthetase [Streptomyces sp. MST-110588]
MNAFATGSGPEDVLTLIRRQFRAAPDTTAVVVGDVALSYRELAAASSALAARLAACGVRAGRAVLLYRQQSADTVVGMLAALWLGAPWCVVEPGQPVGRVHALLKDVDCAAVVFDGTDPATAPEAVRTVTAAGPGPAPALCDFTCATSDTSTATAPPPADVPGDCAAYVISTSGSTGVPKAVVISRANLAHVVATRHEEAGLVTFMPCRLSWDGGLMLLFPTLCTGGTAVLPDARRLPDAQAAAALLRHHRAAAVAGPPSFYSLMLPYLAGADEHLRIVTLGGEVVSPSLVRAHRAALPGARLVNDYGPTETTITVLSHPLPDIPGVPDEPDVPGASDGAGVPDSSRTTVPIGLPTGRTTAYVLDTRLAPAVAGAVGELYIGGPQVGLGYASRPAETAGRFVADPFAGTAGARMYRTGDLARIGPTGDIEFHGREDGQVKVRGARIERQAVRAVLESHPGVGQVAVLGVPEERGGSALVAFWTPAGQDAEAVPTVRDLIDFCAGKLLEQAVPGLFVMVEKMPLSAAGKTDERALLALLPDLPPAGQARTSETAGTEGIERTPGTTETVESLQKAVADLWAEVLRHDGFGPRDSFFDAGGNSHRVVELHMRLQDRWPNALRVGRLFDLNTVEAQAAALAEALAAPGAARPAAAPMAYEV